MQVLAYLLFIPLQIVWLPLTLLGAILVGHRQISVSRKLGVSFTAVEVLNARWTMDVFGLRRDAAARRLVSSIPNDSALGMWLCLFPLWLTSRLCRTPFLYPVVKPPERTGLAEVIVMRTIVIDQMIAARLADTRQFVFLGSGLDTRAYGPLLTGDLAIFELDQAADLANKRQGLAAAGVDASSVRFVEVDFKDPSWMGALKASGYDPAKKTIFLWEGVTLYLTELQVREGLATLRANMANSSLIIADFYAARTLDWGRKTSGAALEKSGEGLKFGLDFSVDAEASLRTFLAESHMRPEAFTPLGGAHPEGPLLAITALAPTL